MLPQIQHETHWEKIRKFFWYVGQILALLYLCVFMMLVCSYLTGFTEPHNRFDETTEFDTRSLWPFGSKQTGQQKFIEKLNDEQKASVIQGSLHIVATIHFCSKEGEDFQKQVCLYTYTEKDLDPVHKRPDKRFGYNPGTNDWNATEPMFICNGSNPIVDPITTDSEFYKAFSDHWDYSIPTTFAAFDMQLEYHRESDNHKLSFWEQKYNFIGFCDEEKALKGNKTESKFRKAMKITWGKWVDDNKDQWRKQRMS